MKTCTYMNCNDEQRVGTTTASAGRVQIGGSSSGEDPATAPSSGQPIFFMYI